MSISVGEAVKNRMVNKKGKFITIEGIEGVGKSTNIEAISAYLTRHNIQYIVTREPGGTKLAESIRQLLLQTDSESPSELTELLLVFAARAQHLENVILPALESGTWVLCDRFTDATYAYQGAGRGLKKQQIAALEQLVQGELRPDITLILDLDPHTGLMRAGNRGALDRFEQEQADFFQRVRQGYLEIAAEEPQRCIVIDASEELNAVSDNVISRLDARLKSDS